MKSMKSSGAFRPFEGLHTLLKTKAVELKPHPFNVADETVDGNLKPDEDRKLFEKAMVGVTPIAKGKYAERNPIIGISNAGAEPSQSEDSKTLLRLENLIQFGEGFRVEDTSEYIDGVGHQVHPAVTRFLHRGNFSVQAHIDLHGLTVEGAKEALDGFLKESIRTAKRTVLVVHGRGLSSPDLPVLKSKVHEWLTTGVWRKWVIAFTSARHQDGGAGATYVMLRLRPTTKKHRKGR